ncbi:hypothetical protein UCREL1_6259 [Eutypa lata UCREL1]|uniref:Uncharacterized protein n=1 Tax=Eutypa lata (strain UCR-EL1) TaxID=1287681 RepID=M7SR99_EUTLA|nr:hypothetical protein UCREL1_6259 [Eutypa lata UCREL1]
MTDKDHLKPNGTCYRIKNVKAGPDFMPCGNANLLGTHFACCNHGDKCLSSNACFHAKTGTTYIAGCTDPTYSHPSCPQKLYFQDQPWLGLVRCGKSNDVHKKEEEWAGCEEPDDLSLDEAPANCDCDGKGALFRDAPILEDIAQLPKKTTGTITYFGDHTPTMPVTSSSSSSSSPSSTSEARPPSTTESSMLTDASTTATSPPFIATSSVTPPDSPVITVGAKAGVGIGSALGALLIGCMVFMALSLRKRKKKRQQQAQDSQEGSPAAGQGQISSANTDVPLVSPAMSGFKSELSADEPNIVGASVAGAIFGSLRLICGDNCMWIHA